MQLITSPEFKQPIGYNPTTQRWFACAGDVVIGEHFASPAAAERARADYLVLHPEEQPAPDVDDVIAQSRALLEAALEAAGDTDPLTLYTPVGPFPGLPIAPGALERAYALILMDHGDERAVMERARRALALAEDPDAWSIPEPGVLRVRGSRPNQVYLIRNVPIEEQNETIRECTQLQLDSSDPETVLKEQPCPDHAKRVATTANQCKHLICRELIRLAQLLTHAAQATTVTAEAMVTLPTGFLGSMLSLVCFSGEDHISLTIDQSVLRVELGGKHAVQLTAETGDGHCAMVFTRDVLHRLWTDLRPQLIQQREARAVCHIDRALATLCVAGPGFQLSCPGRVL
jgi:hypothetical protein